MVAAFTPLPLGFVLDGKWRIDGLLGNGGMGAVYRATHVRNKVTLAAKVLHPAIANDPVARERFLLEGYAANAVGGGGGTVQVLDDGKSADGYVYLVMELLEGETVDASAERRGGTLPVDETLRIAEELLTTLAAAHAQGILHRDVKPENMFLTRSGQLKVLDFGLASINQHTSQARLTITGEPMGTAAFMPAEQALAIWDQVDARSDVYSVAASVWTLLTNTLVQDGATIPQLLVNVSTKQAAPIRSVAPELPQPIADVFDRALRFDRRGRWGNAGDMLRALRDAMSRCGMAGSLPYERTVAASVPGVAIAQTAAPVHAANGGVAVRALEAARTESPEPTRTVAPVSSGGRTERVRGSTRVIAFVATAVVAAGLIAAVGFYVIDRRTPSAESTAGGPVSSAVARASPPAIEVRVMPADEASSAATTNAAASGTVSLPTATASSSVAGASSGVPHPVMPLVQRPVAASKPTVQPEDPLGVYRPR